MVLGRVIEYHGSIFICHDFRNALHVYQCDLKNEDEEDLSMLVHDIQHLTLEGCEGLSNSLINDFSRLNKPSSIKVLEIDGCRGIECILTNEQFLTASQELESRFLPLQHLERIYLIGLQDFVNLIPNIEVAVEPPQPQAVVFSSLRSIRVCKCNKMRKLGLPLSEFLNFEEIYIGYCDEIEEIIEVRDGEERVVSLPKLKELRLRDLPILKSICNARLFLDSVKRIELIRCRELKKLHLHFDATSHSPPQTLERILIGEGDKEWWESLEWEHPTHRHLLQPLLEYW